MQKTVFIQLAEVSGVPIECDDFVLSQPHRINLKMADASLLDILSVVSMLCNSQLWEGKRTAWIGEPGDHELVCRLYDLQDLGALYGGYTSASEALDWLIRDSMGYEIFDYEPRANMMQLNHLLAINLPPSSHKRIEVLIEAMAAVRRK